MWLRSVRHWLAYKEMDEAEKARSFPVMLRGSALIWYENVSEDIKEDFEKTAEAFLARYHIVGVTGWKDAASMWCTPQLPHQSVDDYLNQMERKPSKTSMPEEQKRYAIINGLKPSIRQQVRPRFNPASKILEEILQRSRHGSRSHPDGAIFKIDLERHPIRGGAPTACDRTRNLRVQRRI